jgi:hypothetical protein
MKLLALPFALPLALIAAPALAGTFTPPEGCKTYVTIQAQGCSVSHLYTCEGDAKGDQWRADYGADGPVFLSKIDGEAQWLESYEIAPPTKETLDANPADPASFSELLANGLDTFDFTLTKDDGTHTRVVGFDKMLGTTQVIDGVTLQRTEYEYTQTDDAGNTLRHSRGQEFIQPEWRTFLSGRSEWESEDGTWTPFDNAPVKLLMPGQPGFQSTIPLFDCDAQSASFQLPHGD